jgi:hypothetical protein
MTKDEVLALEGRELTIRLGERLFTWDGEQARRFSGIADGLGMVDTWSGLGDIEARMAQRGYRLRLASSFEPGLPYWARFVPHGTFGQNAPLRMEGATAPLAVARAALLALLSEESANA